MRVGGGPQASKMQQKVLTGWAGPPTEKKHGGKRHWYGNREEGKVQAEDACIAMQLG